MAGIVIIGDNLLIRTLLREIVSDAGHTVLADFKSGPPAMSAVVAMRPKLVILDMVLVRRVGLVTVRELKSIDRTVAIVVCAALVERGNAIAALKVGASGFVIKPFDAKTVLGAVDDALSRAGARAPAARLGSTPLSAPPRGAADEHRDFARVRASLPVVIAAEDGTELEISTVDVSGGGLLLAGGSLALGTTVEFRLDLCTGEAPVAGSARVVRITEDGLPALEFEHVHIADHERLTAYLSEQNRSEQGEGSRRTASSSAPELL